jgi:hypothetical protein
VNEIIERLVREVVKRLQFPERDAIGAVALVLSPQHMAVIRAAMEDAFDEGKEFGLSLVDYAP